MDEFEAYLRDGEEVAITPHLRVSCDGGNGVLGHPREFLTLVRGGEMTCKYCDRRFLHVTHPEVEAVRREGMPLEPNGQLKKGGPARMPR